MIRMFGQFLTISEDTHHKRSVHLEKMLAEKKELRLQWKSMEEERNQSIVSTTQELIALLKEAGVTCSSDEYFALGYLAKDVAMTTLFREYGTPEERLMFLRKYMTNTLGMN
jgi:hypothetical protein